MNLRLFRIVEDGLAYRPYPDLLSTLELVEVFRGSLAVHGEKICYFLDCEAFWMLLQKFQNTLLVAVRGARNLFTIGDGY